MKTKIVPFSQVPVNATFFDSDKGLVDDDLASVVDYYDTYIKIADDKVLAVFSGAGTFTSMFKPDEEVCMIEMWSV